MTIPETISDPFLLSPSRVHEAEGRGRFAFALYQAARHAGPVIWVVSDHAAHLPMLRGLPDGVGERLHLIRPAKETDLLWSVEEALRSAPVALVIAEPEEPLSLTAGRRLQLAAEAGQTVGVMLIRAGAGSNAAQTRWHCQPQAARDSTLHHWSLIKNKTGTIADWRLYWDGRSADCHMVSAAGQRPLPAKTVL